MEHLNLTVYVWPEGLYWIAQCREHDICAQGRGPLDAQGQFVGALTAELNNPPNHVLDNALPLSWIPALPAEAEIKDLDYSLRTTTWFISGVCFQINFREFGSQHET